MADLLSAKLALEDDLAPRLYRLIGRYVRARVQVRYLSPLAVQQAQAAFAELLQRHYARVVMVVTGRGWPRSPDIKEAALSWWHYERLVERSRKSAEMLIRSIERVVLETEAPQRKSLDFAEYKAGLAGELWRKAKAVIAKIKGKLKGIVAAETNGVAEESRYEQAKQRAGNRKLSKRWSTMLDDRVRPTHQAAEGQVRPANTPFSVGASLMMVPGDITFGAPIGERINCRCSAVYFAENADGTLEDLSATERGYSYYRG